MDAFVCTLPLSKAKKLQEDLMAQGFEMSQPPYTIFAAKKAGISCTLYTSGKLMVQGKAKEEFITFYLEPEILESLSYSHPLSEFNETPRIGIDEAGKGDFFGPLCIGGVFADKEGLKKLSELKVRDSKKLGDPTILKLATQIRSFLPYSLIRIFPQKYNELYAKFKNLNSLLAWGHSAAIEELVEKTKCQEVIIDQFAKEYVVENALSRKGVKVTLTQRHKGEEDLVVAAASILARAGFVEGIDQLSKMVGLSLPKGASHQVIETGKRLVHAQGKDILKKVGKLHFKTLDLILHVNESDS